MHLFILFTDKKEGEKIRYDGGPDADLITISNVNNKPLQVYPSNHSGLFLTFYSEKISVTEKGSNYKGIDNENKVTELEGSSACNLKACLEREARNINSWNIPYINIPPVLYQNSNSVARTILHNCKLPEDKKDWWWFSPGWDKILSQSDRSKWPLPYEWKLPGDPLSVCELFGGCPGL